MQVVSAVNQAWPTSICSKTSYSLIGHAIIRVSWCGLASEFFVAHNGIKQGGIASPVLFCIYIDDLLVRLAQSSVGCFIGFNFVGALAYADDIVLI